MARTLPWNVKHEPPAKKPRVTPAPRLKKEQVSAPTDDDRSETKGTSRTRGRVSRPDITPKSSRRTPSSSPVRGPPAVQLMHQGYDRDDGYIMVEDELQTVAQSYTAHLHHAEYKRLVKQARQAPPKALPAPTSPMSEEAKNRLKTAALERRQRNTLRRVTADKTREGEEEGEDEKVANLWSGTSLAPLMVGGNEQKRSLVGLEGISSSTKAGLGLTRIQSSRKETRGGNEGDALELNDVHGKAPQQRDAVVNAITSQTIPVTRVVDKNSSESRPAPAVGEPATRPLTKRKFFFDLDDGWDTPETVIKSEDDRRKSRPALLSDKGKEKKSRLDEVPMWL